MFGILLISAGTLFSEVSTSIGKDQVGKHKESIYTMGFLSLFFGVIFFFISALVRGSFVFSLASLPTFSIRCVLEIIQAHFTMRALTTADRTTFGFLRIITIPLLLLVDLFIGYAITPTQIMGIILLVLTLVFLLMNHGISKKGSGLVIFTAINAVITLSLFKYNITNFNSVEAEEGIIFMLIMIYLFFSAKYIAKENPFSFLKKRLFFAESMTAGFASVLESFAFVFAPASIMLAAKRSASILWTIISGNVFFKEKHPIIKIIAFAFIIIGIILLI